MCNLPLALNIIRDQVSSECLLYCITLENLKKQPESGPSSILSISREATCADFCLVKTAQNCRPKKLPKAFRML